MTADAAVERAAALLRGADSILFITGAGLSADSGLPTYRGIGGLYEDELTEEGIPIEVALSGRMLQAEPAVCWKYISRIERACRGARHNRGHRVIAEIERTHERVWTLTQNVDGFHREAGSTNVIEIHGDIHDLRCTECSWGERVEDYADIDELPPRCPECGAVVRPDVVLFGEMLPLDPVTTMERELGRGFDLVFSVGTTSVFPYIAGPVLKAAASGIPTVEINPTETEVSPFVEVKVPLRAVLALPRIWTLAQTH